MSAHAKTHPTEIIIKSKKGTKTFQVPKKAETQILSLLKEFESERVPWREALSSEIASFTEVGLALRGARQKENLTQKELADKMGIEQSHVSQMEHGKRPIGKAMAKRFSKVLNIDYKIFL